MTHKVYKGSFRDPSGFIFMKGNTVYRQINPVYQELWDRFINSGLYDTLVKNELLIPHVEEALPGREKSGAYKIIKPEQIPFISYPYEWCFKQLKQAALMTLEIQKTALSFGMSLKDCSAYNIQFKKGKPIFIDTLSFEKYHAGQSWIAYRQFCQHFLCPLALMAYRDIRLNLLSRIYTDGIPLDLASVLLPPSTYFSLPLLFHVHLHAKSQRFLADKDVKPREYRLRPSSVRALIDNLKSAILKIELKANISQWATYYSESNYTPKALDHKQQIVSHYLDLIAPKVVWDLGANTGLFSRLASRKGIRTISFDSDPVCVEKNYRLAIKENTYDLLPLTLDLMNPSTSIGWRNRERLSLIERGPAEVVMALALIHHLAIYNNVPLDEIAAFLADICEYLIIEFVPKNDSQVQTMLAIRQDIFINYNQNGFEENFTKKFVIQDRVRIHNSERTLYLMRKR